MLDSLLNIGRFFDWITPTIALIQDFYFGSEYDINIPTGSGWTRTEINHLFSKHGVKVWGILYSLDGEELMFSVPEEQAEYALYLLENGGEPYHEIHEGFDYS